VKVTSYQVSVKNLGFLFGDNAQKMMQAEVVWNILVQVTKLRERVKKMTSWSKKMAGASEISILIIS